MRNLSRRTSEGKVLVPHPAESVAVRLAYEWYAQGDLSDLDISVTRATRTQPDGTIGCATYSVRAETVEDQVDTIIQRFKIPDEWRERIAAPHSGQVPRYRTTVPCGSRTMSGCQTSGAYAIQLLISPMVSSTLASRRQMTESGWPAMNQQRRSDNLTLDLSARRARAWAGARSG